MATKTTLRAGTPVRFRDENDRPVMGRVIEYSQANDGTGRHGYWIRTEAGSSVYWRQCVRRA